MEKYDGCSIYNSLIEAYSADIINLLNLEWKYDGCSIYNSLIYTFSAELAIKGCLLSILN